MNKTTYIIAVILIFYSKLSYSTEIDADFFNLILPDSMHVEWGRDEGVIYAREKIETSQDIALLIIYAPINNRKFKTHGLSTEQLVKKSLKQFKSRNPKEVPRSDGIIEYRFMYKKNINDVNHYFVTITLGVEKGVLRLQYSCTESMNSSIKHAENLINEIKWK